MKKTLLAAVAGIAFTATLAAGAQVVVRIGPPPPRVVERVPPPPPEHRDWAWHNGYHRWDGQRYVWVPGAYEQPPRPRAVWVEGHWCSVVAATFGAKDTGAKSCSVLRSQVAGGAV